MPNQTWEDFQKRQAEIKKQAGEKIIAEIRERHPLTIGEYLRQQFPDDAERILKADNIPANYIFWETPDVGDCIQCARTLANGQTISYVFSIDALWTVVYWYLYPKEDPNQPDTRTFEQIPDEAQLASHTHLTVEQSAKLLTMTTNIIDINQAAWMSLTGDSFENILKQLFGNSPSEG